MQPWLISLPFNNNKTHHERRAPRMGGGVSQGTCETHLPLLELKPSHLNPLGAFLDFFKLLWSSKGRHKAIHILMERHLYINIRSSRNFSLGFNQGDYSHHGLNICNFNWSLVSHQMPLPVVSILGPCGNGLTPNGNQMLCQCSVQSNYKMNPKFQQMILEWWGKVQWMALTLPPDAVCKGKNPDNNRALFCLLVWDMVSLHTAGYPWTH